MRPSPGGASGPTTRTWGASGASKGSAACSTPRGPPATRTRPSPPSPSSTPPPARRHPGPAPASGPKHFGYKKRPERSFAPDEMVNYVTPGYAPSVYVSSLSVQRIRTTAESHRRIAIIEVMGRDCGMISLGTAYGQPDIILI